MRDAASRVRSATSRAKSDVANKLVSMFLHELSRRVSERWPIKIDSPEYEQLVRQFFGNRCPYCLRDLAGADSIIEHPDGMNRYRAGLHVPGNVVIACKRCNSEKRRDDSLKVLSLAGSGWASFLSHDGSQCASSCSTCLYWEGVWPDETERKRRLPENLQRIESFRNNFPELAKILPSLGATLPDLLAKLYADCQTFAETEVRALVARFEEAGQEGGHAVAPQS